jgi:hypothetical protein
MADVGEAGGKPLSASLVVSFGLIRWPASPSRRWPAC